MENGFDYEEKKEEEQSSEGENEYVYKTVMDGKHNSRIWSVASLIIAVISLLCCCLGWASLIMAVIAIVFAVVSRKNIGFFDGVGLAGLIVGIFGAVFSLTFLLAEVFIVNTEYFREFVQEIEGVMGEMEAGEL